MGEMFGFMDLLVAFCGVYLIYAAVQMKRTGEISSTLVGKGYDPKKARDPKGYIDYMYPKTIVMGVAVILSGGLNYVNDRYLDIPNFNLIICGVFLLMIIIFSKIMVDAQKKYLAPE